MITVSPAPLRLRKGHDRRLRSGHCWIYSNEVDIEATPLKAFDPGQPVDVFGDAGKWLGSGYVNPHSLICARLVSRNRAHPLDQSLLRHRFNVALSLRERLFDQPCYRLVFGESDGLPGLVVDRFGDLAVVQIGTAGMERLRDGILDALSRALSPQGVLLRNDAAMRELEGLPRYVEAVGAVPDKASVIEGECRFETSLAGGQKTGWFFDQSGNRGRMLRYVAGRRVLDLCSYVGAWGVRAAAAGAAEVLCVDSSSSAIHAVEENARLNAVGDRVATQCGDVFEVSRQLRAAGERFDVVMLDPPAFIKRRKDQQAGLLAYRRLNQQALQLVANDGILITSSCSYHLSSEAFIKVIQQAARHVDRSVQLLEQGHQAPDHPVHPAMPETAYLKTLYLRVLPSF